MIHPFLCSVHGYICDEVARSINGHPLRREVVRGRRAKITQRVSTGLRYQYCDCDVCLESLGMPVVQAYRVRRVLLGGHVCGMVNDPIEFDVNQKPTCGSLPVIAQSRVRAWPQFEEKGSPGTHFIAAIQLACNSRAFFDLHARRHCRRLLCTASGA